MDLKEQYQQKVTTPQEAVKAVGSGDWVDYGWCTATPVALDGALAKRYEELEDVKVRGAIVFKRPEIFNVPDAGRHFSWNSWHMGGVERKMIAEDLAYYIPLRYSELPRYYKECVDPIQVAMFQVAPMDEEGYFNFGPNTSHMTAVCQRAEVIIVEVNRNMPVCLGSGNEKIHIDQVTHIVEGDHPAMWQLGGAGAATEVDNAVAQLIVEKIPNKACLQLGIGGMPNAVGSLIAQSDLRDLGVHTEMYVDAFVDMAASGKISGAYKNLDRGKQVYAFAAGTQKLYDYLHKNPECLGATVDYTNDARVISQIDNFISINNTVDLDLFGQVSAETSGLKHISGAGGQLDFVLGAYLSKGGKSFICCSSAVADREGKLQSRILPTLTPGSVVTDTRSNVHYVVTEYGMVNLKGASTWQRAEKLISIAHPNFREELIAAADKMKIWRRTNKR